MAPTPTNLTYRVWIKYSCGSAQHELLLRLPETASVEACQAKANQMIAVMRPIMITADQVIGARISLPGSVISFPLEVTTGAGTAVGSPVGDESATQFISATGRDIEGVRTRVTLFSQYFTGFTDFRYGIDVVSAEVAAWWAEVSDSTPYALVSAAGYVPVWNSYINVGFNAYFQRKFR